MPEGAGDDFAGTLGLGFVASGPEVQRMDPGPSLNQLLGLWMLKLSVSPEGADPVAAVSNVRLLAVADTT